MKNNTKPFITITISMYNNLSGLEKTVPSIMKQDYTNAEVIISDDGSRELDTEKLNEYADLLRTRFKEVYININEKNEGTVRHLNRLYRMAKGKYFFDASPGDAFVNEHTISEVVDYFEKTGNLIVTTRRLDEYEDGTTKIRPAGYIKPLLAFFPGALCNYMIRKKNVLSGCGTYYSKELFEKYGYFDEEYVLLEDYPYYVKLLKNKVRIGCMNKVTISHEMGGVSNGDVHPLIWKDLEHFKSKYC